MLCQLSYLPEYKCAFHLDLKVASHSGGLRSPRKSGIPEVIADTMFTWARELGAIDFAHWTLIREGWKDGTSESCEHVLRYDLVF